MERREVDEIRRKRRNKRARVRGKKQQQRDQLDSSIV